MTSDSESVSVQDVLAENNCIVKEVKEAASPDKSARKRNDDLGSVTEPAVKKPRVEAAVVSKPVSLTSDKKSLSLMDSARNTLARSPLGQRALCAVASAWDKGQSLAAHYVTEYRGIFVVLFLLPISFASDVLWALHHLYVCYLLGAQSPAAHAKRVTKVQEQVMTARKQGQTKMCTARPAWLAMSFREGLYKSKWAKIDLNDFNHVLKVDTNRRIIRCEPLCSMGQLTHALIRKGWTLAVTPELDDLTVGGLIMGFGVETSSHRHGLFQHTVKALEIVLPDGTFKRTTADLNADLFYAVPWSHGTLGFLVAAEIEVCFFSIVIIDASSLNTALLDCALSAPC